MSTKYKVRNPDGIYFVTTTVIDWVDIFTRPIYKQIVVDSLNYCIAKKGLKVYAWVIMSNHIHLIVSAEEGVLLENIMRDFKRFTSKKLFESMNEFSESRRAWLIKKFVFAGERIQRNSEFKIWKDGFHPIELNTNELMAQKMDYIHQNPVKDEIVILPEHYVYSSAVDYCGEKGLVQLTKLE